jgi:hypothetical protein
VVAALVAVAAASAAVVMASQIFKEKIAVKKLAFLFALFMALPAVAQNWTTVSASNITGLNQTPLAHGRLCAVGTDSHDVPINFMVGGGGQVTRQTPPFCSTVTNGVLTSFSVPNPANTAPSGINYRFFGYDSSTGQQILWCSNVVFTGGTFNFDLYQGCGGQTAQANVSGASISGPFTVNGNIIWTGTATGSGVGAVTMGAVNVLDSCGIKNDNSTDIYANLVTCLNTYKGAHFIFPGCNFNPQGGGTANVPCYYSSQQINVSYNGTWFDGATPATWNAPVSIRFPTNTGGVRFDKNCYGCKISNLGLIGPDLWSSTSLATFPAWTPALLAGDGPDGLQLLGGNNIVENVVVQGFARHGIYLDGTSNIQSPSQPDAWRMIHVLASSNRGYGIHTNGCDSNVGTFLHGNTRGNMLAGIYDYSCLGNTWIEPNSALDGRSAVNAGATSNVSTVSVSGTTMTLTTATAVAGWVASTWVTVAGTVSCNGTFKVLSGTSSNMTLNYPSGACTSEAVGTAQTASSTNVFAAMTALSAGAGQAPIIECAYGSRSGSSVQVWINPYQESNSAPPCWDTGTMVLGGQLASTKVQAAGQGFLWITNPAGGLLAKGGQSFTFQNPADSLTTLNIKAGATALADESIRFIAFDGSIKHFIKVSSVGSSISFGDTGAATWLGKTPGGTAFMRGATNTEDITFQQSSGRDELHYCGSATVCGKFLLSDSAFHVLNSVSPFTAGGATSGTAPLPWSSVYIGNAATNNIQLTGTASSAKVATLPNNTGTIAELNLAQSFTAAQTFTGQIISSIATGTAPFTVSSTTAVANLTLAADTQLPTISTAGKVSDSALPASMATKTLVSPTVNTGISQGTGIKHGRVTTGSIALSSSAAVTLTWGGSAFADTSYTVTCSVVEATASASTLRVHHVESITTTTAVVRVVNDDSGGAHTGTLHCIAMHD